MCVSRGLCVCVLARVSVFVCMCVAGKGQSNVCFALILCKAHVLARGTNFSEIVPRRGCPQNFKSKCLNLSNVATLRDKPVSLLFKASHSFLQTVVYSQTVIHM